MASLVPFKVRWRMTAIDSAFKVMHQNDSVITDFIAESIAGVAPLKLAPIKVRLVFGGVVFYTYRKSFGDDDAVALCEYDRSYPFYGVSRDADLLLNDQWLSTGICCDPFAYEVVGSPSLKPYLSNDHKWREYLLAGEDAAMSIAASTLQISEPS